MQFSANIKKRELKKSIIKVTKKKQFFGIISILNKCFINKVYVSKIYILRLPFSHQWWFIIGFILVWS